ncbi:MAG TPA: type II secretion system F family protein [Jatrophihabitantaceae bacterium]|jgi:tight adherence protein C
MNGLPLALGLACIATAIGLGIYVLTAKRTVTAEVVVESAPVKTTESGELPSILVRFGALARKLSPSDYARRVQRRLDLAGNPRQWTPDRLLAFKGLGLVTGAALGFLFTVTHGALVAILFTAGLGALGLFLPDILVKNAGDKRQLKLQRALPDAMDMLMVCVEAGLGFDAALGRVARNSTGPIAEECARVLQEMQFGMSRADALRALAGRTEVAELKTFVSAMIQSGELGISIGDVLREQSKEMRVKRRQRAEERAQKLQVKLLFPLIFCLLPAMFVVVLAPAALNIIKFFGKVN